MHLILKDELTQNLKNTSMLGVLQTIELPTVDLLTAMETKGVLIDVEFLKKESQTLNDDIRKVEKEIHDEAGEVFNVASPKQLGHILFEKMGLPKGKKTKTGFSTNTDVLEKYEDTFPITKNVIQFRELSKLKSTYVDALPSLVNPETGRVHTQYNQALTATGRLSSVHPNLQNIPIRTERGLRIRRGFIAEKGHVLVSADYSQIELRILAHISKDPGLKDAFMNDIDIHTKAASEIFSVPIDKVGDDLRRKAKAVNFGIAYGQGAFGLSEALKISRGEAKEIIDLYFQRFVGVKEYMTEVVEFVQQHGYVETILGRRRYLPEIRSKNNNIKAFAERAAINAPIQGMSSDLVKLAMIEVGHEFRDEMVLQVHDELIFEIKEDKHLETKMQKIKSLMENCMTLDVPLKVNTSVGKNWAEL
jgi:DNA polymerase I